MKVKQGAKKNTAQYSRGKSNFAVFTALALSSLLFGCLGQPAPVGFSTKTSNSTTTTSSSPDLSTYQSAKSVKLIFNKQNFYNNYKPNSANCAGDARYFYSIDEDRRIPTKPNWLKNVAVELTNSNALGGVSRALSCGLSGLGSPSASSCASFDDGQPNDGTQAKSIIVGGATCASGTANCNPNVISNEIWNFVVPDASTASVFVKQSQVIPDISTRRGLVYAAADFDEQHNQLYIYGGANQHTVTTSYFSSNLLKLSYDSDGTLSTLEEPTAVTPSVQYAYAGWTNTALAGNIANDMPGSLAGATFTYSSRRDPTMKTYCSSGAAAGTVVGGNCVSSYQTTSGQSDWAIALNEHQDYLLLTGGLKDTGLFSKTFHAYSPHQMSNDVGTASGYTKQTGGQWNLLSNCATGLCGAYSLDVMSIADITAQSSSTEPYAPTFVGASFTGWAGRGYHRTVFDPMMNRFYIFGGLQNSGGASALTGGTTPDIASSDVWVYDPPALGRKPTAACFTSTAVDANSIPSTSGVFFSANKNLNVNRAYTSGQFVFPPGGCLQRIQLGTYPGVRFEHGMAFDRDQKAMMVFGGCNEAATIPPAVPATGSASGTIAGDPTLSCNSAGNLLNDTWIYLAPTRTEYVSKDYRSTTAGPYYSTTLLANVFSIDYWMDRISAFISDNPDYGRLSVPTEAQVKGAWFQLSPTTYPTKRVSPSLTYDRAHHKYYLFGGFGCVDSSCSSVQALNDVWEFTPPTLETDCNVNTHTCSSQGSWKQLYVNRDAPLANKSQPTQRKGAIMAFAQSSALSGDEFYTLTDRACAGQGSVNTGDASSSKKGVGAIYIDIDRSQLASNENLLINLRLLPFDRYTKLPGIYDSSTPFTTTDDTDQASRNDTAIIRVQYLHNNISSADSIQRAIQPRYHELTSGTPVIGDTVMYIGATGQITEKQIMVPLKLDPSINLIKIERIEGSAKFYEMSLSKF